MNRLDKFSKHTMVHENDLYLVFCGHFPDDMEMTISGLRFRNGYFVVNKQTAMVEYCTLQLPDAIGTAAQLELMMTRRPWEPNPVEGLFTITKTPDPFH